MKTWATIARYVEAGQRCALVSVASTAGSAPRDCGAHMIVTTEGYHGTIGGGTLEWRAIASAQAMIAHETKFKITSHALGPELGQCCGGRVSLATEVFDTTDRAIAGELARREAEGAFAVVRNGIKLEFGEERRTLYLYGAGHVGRALVLALAPLPFDVIWIDSRPDAFPRAAPENATLCAPIDPAAELQSAKEGSLVFIMSHSHALDLAIADAALRNPQVAHVGLIGSKTKRARFEKRLSEAGIPQEKIDALICPIGVPGIGSKLPAMIAAATAAQILVLDEQLHLASHMKWPQAEPKRLKGRL